MRDLKFWRNFLFKKYNKLLRLNYIKNWVQLKMLLNYYGIFFNRLIVKYAVWFLYNKLYVLYRF